MINDKKISFCNQVYNEPEAIRRYLNSCLYFDNIVDEVFIINHRSSDDTLDIIKSFVDTYDKTNIKLRFKTEPRDFSKDFMIADLFGDAVASCENEIVFRHDADFVFGPKYTDLVKVCVSHLSNPSVYACGYEIPCVSKSLEIVDGMIKSFGFCNLHVPVPRVFKKTKTVCRQDHMGGKYEFFYPTDSKCSQWVQMKYVKDSLISVNIKPEERMKQRETMNTYMKDVVDGVDHDNWMDCDELKSEIEPQNKPSFRSFNIIGQRILHDDIYFIDKVK